MNDKELADLIDRSRRLASAGCLTSMQILKIVGELEYTRQALVEAREFNLRLANRIFLAHEILAHLANKKKRTT